MKLFLDSAKTDEILDTVIEGEETVIVTLADGRKFALVPGAEWQSLDETSYLTSTPGNRSALAQGLKEVAEGKTVEVDLKDIGYEFKVPIIILQGRYDLHTPYEMCRDYFERLKAPHKRFITFERSAHYPMFEESGRFLVTLVNEVLPLTTERAEFRVLPETRNLK